MIAFFTVALLSTPLLCTAASTLEASNAMTRQLIQQTMKDARIPGLQIAVVKDGHVVLLESYGLANVENHVPVTAATLFPINSATKSFTGVAMMQLADAGRVDLDAPISRYLDGSPMRGKASAFDSCLPIRRGFPTSWTGKGWLEVAPSRRRGLQ